ncbi:MAG TPA: histidine kinase, partial [Nitrospirae bacterium]|nr:histidine kinase [Nitrospirota bacterium]
MDTKDEIGQLSRSFDQMTERLKRVSVSRDELVKENIKRRQMGNALKAANRELEAFSYSVSHDLRAPLRSIDGFSRALLEDYLDRLDEKGKDYLNRVCRASQRMGQLIDDMLILSRVVRAEMHYEEVDL